MAIPMKMIRAYEEVVEFILKHGGPTSFENLALACTFCNRAKGSDIGSILWETGEFLRYFNPRLDRWADHFQIDGIAIRPSQKFGRSLPEF